jgi:hypothetical protein
MGDDWKVASHFLLGRQCTLGLYYQISFNSYKFDLQTISSLLPKGYFHLK